MPARLGCLQRTKRREGLDASSRPLFESARLRSSRCPAAVVVAGILTALALSALSAQTPDDIEQTLTHGGLTRSYLVHGFARAPKAPVVIVLHGGGGNAQNAVHMTGWDRVAKREGLIAVYPNGTAARARGILLTWNATHCCAAAMTNRVDDVGFVGALIDRLVASGRADATRVYVTGMSNGGMMTHRLGRELPTKIAAIAPVVGALFGDEPPATAPMPAFIVNGADDDIVPGRGGSIGAGRLFEMAADRPVSPAIDQATYWAKANGCGEPKHADSPQAAVTEWRMCKSGAPVTFNVVAGNAHAWPGGEPGRAGAAQPTKAWDATERMWEFFKDKRR